MKVSSEANCQPLSNFVAANSALSAFSITSVKLFSLVYLAAPIHAVLSPSLRKSILFISSLRLFSLFSHSCCDTASINMAKSEPDTLKRVTLSGNCMAASFSFFAAALTYSSPSAPPSKLFTRASCVNLINTT